MPVIPTYDAPQLGLTPSETGIDALQQAARRVGAFASESGQLTAQLGQRIGSTVKDTGELALKSIEHHETAAGAKNYADMVAALTSDWTQTAKNADPNDASVAQKWREQVMEPALEKFSSQGFLTEGGQQWAQNHVAALRQHLVEKNTTDMSTLAGVAAQTNFAEVTNKLASTVRLDPSSLDFALKTADTSLGGIIDSSPNLSAANAARVREEGLLKAREGIVKSAVIGMIEKNPNLDMSAIEAKYGQYMKPGEMSQLVNFSKAQAKANLYYDRQAQLIEKQQADLKVHKDATDLMAKGVQVDPNNASRLLISPDFMKGALDIAKNNPNAPSAAATVRTMLDWAESQQRQRTEPVVSDATVKADLLSRIGDQNNPTTEMQVLDWAARDKLSARDTTLFREMVKSIGPEAMRDPLVHTALQGASERAGVGLMNDGHQRYSNFLQAFWPEYLRQKNAGTLRPNALDFNDETSLIRQTLKTYEPTQQQRLNAALMKRLDLGTEGAGAPATITPENRQKAEDWLKKNPNDPMAAAVRQKLDAAPAPVSPQPARSITSPPAEAVSPAAGEINAQLPPKTPELASELSRMPASVLKTVGRTVRGQAVAVQQISEAERWIHQQAARTPSAALNAVLNGLRRNAEGLKQLAEAQKYLREKGGEGAARALAAFNESAEK